MPLLKSTCVSARVSAALCDKILRNDFAQGEHLVEKDIAEMFGVSITPVREAFNSLQKQGLLTAIPYRGTFVTILTYEFAENLLTIRKTIETAAAKLSFDKILPSDADELEKLCRQADFYAEQGDHLASIRCDIEFHEFFIRKAENELLYEIWNLLKNRVAFFQSVTRPYCQAVIPLLSDRHMYIIQAVRHENLNGLCTALCEHLDTTMERAKLPHASESRDY